MLVVNAIVVGVIVGCLVSFGERGFTARRGNRSREQRAARVLRDEMAWAINALDSALRDSDPSWLAGLSASRTVAEAWYEHGDALVALGPEHWEVLGDAVSSDPASYELSSGTAQSDDLKQALGRRREQLAAGAEVLCVVAADDRRGKRRRELRALAQTRQQRR